MVENLFSASRMKLQRARHFITELEAALEAFKADDPVSGVMLNDQMQITVKPITDWPSAIVGDAIHSMRTALDLMASEMARLKNRSDKDVYFPFSDSAETFDDAIARRRFAKAGDDAVALLKTFEPYRGGNDRLRAIHDLDIQDKHTGIIVTLAQFSVQYEASYDVNNIAAGTVKADLAAMHYRFPDNASFFAGANAIETLKELVDMVEGLLEAFAALVTPRG
ncbi:MAG: hypothetical protein HY834_11290 [Devosia nanyangense]|uniref:Uncharacterized protein n=1 Tax=Devosia nanyangense TaxID=1228055 RepID=A0A933NYI7_9HYPH|nr:hypothetical protein [Devosia nanyangense]